MCYYQATYGRLAWLRCISGALSGLINGSDALKTKGLVSPYPIYETKTSSNVTKTPSDLAHLA
jgi:hypothetical protein